ncbi:antA/AntB antirepressor family protein [Bartonella bilalgolemii]|uniref:AntA/AntB antirepressor family protein n=1 Tax=Bartonella bilalgolemii TaxID=2942911 RepID=A0ABT0P9M3_9HYPH|nr:antA/AntB antirepressor family protein [Bartonella sp. G70]MCL6230163.1 antA/AntB antirepressor family protein [Bartonella sp. G70]
MNTLIKITEQTIDQETVQTVNARELHAFLEITSKFADWIKNRIKECKFLESIDFITLSKNLENGGKVKEYHITLDMAKHLSMIERNDKGHQAREYFIECEKIAKQVATPQIDYSSPEAMIGFLNHLQSQIEQKDHVIAELAPKAEALEGLKRSDGLFGLIEAAKMLEVRPKELTDYFYKNIRLPLDNVATI